MHWSFINDGALLRSQIEEQLGSHFQERRTQITTQNRKFGQLLQYLRKNKTAEGGDEAGNSTSGGGEKDMSVEDLIKSMWLFGGPEPEKINDDTQSGGEDQYNYLQEVGWNGKLLYGNYSGSFMFDQSI